MMLSLLQIYFYISAFVCFFIAFGLVADLVKKRRIELHDRKLLDSRLQKIKDSSDITDSVYVSLPYWK